MTNEPQTLSGRIAEGRLSVREALRFAVQLGDSLRRVHDEGRVQGPFTPDLVILNGPCLEFAGAAPGAAEVLTPYTAPELIHENSPDARSDIFSFGAVVYEMLTGRHAFGGDSAEALAESIVTSEPAPIGLPGFDRLVSTCLAKDPAERWQRMQHVVTETRLAATMCRAANSSATRENQIKALRAEVEMLESRLVSQLNRYESIVAQMHAEAAVEFSRQQAASTEVVSETLKSVRVRFNETESRIEAALGRAVQAEQVADRALAEIAGLQGSVCAELSDLATKVEAQGTAVEVGRAHVARTDDLVERVVEALEVLQGMVLEHTEERAAVAG